MKTAWNWFVLLCNVINAIVVSASWYSGEPAWWFVWASSIYFSVDMALKYVLKLQGAEVSP